ncbi:uncharacterized protein N7477_009938 [Penicillium maclennaniae]|uniref:uncharacterized protein n=1 Tax=Penicillium maclennaniae TaxID=1343394 RepID=UPI002540C25F|nr:uncharacterized protein N7477_009938 [Penicillium maclennaniae]KAJ5662322.1 hypothetical protein N7477_009938 [Penicillium maclennaniae]
MSDLTKSLEGASLANGLVPRRLLREEITYSVAKEKDYNVLHEWSYWDRRSQFFRHIQSHHLLLQNIVAHHLGVSSDVCRVTEPREWIHGSFNVCISIDMDATARHCGRKVMLRLPLPYKLGEDKYPGSVDEKIRCEAGTYVWLQENCPTVPIPELYGFGMSTGQAFTALKFRPLMTRMIWSLRRTISKWLGYPLATRYIPRTYIEASVLGSGYLLIEYIDSSQGEMLSNTWPEKRQVSKVRQNLSRDLSRTLLILSHIPLSKIGSFTIEQQRLPYPKQQTPHP